MKALLSNEMLKLIRQPAILFWGFLAVPFFALLFRLALEMLVFVRTGQSLPQAVDLFLSAAKALSISGNSVGHLLFAIGIACVFSTEYRFSTWRHLVPRSGRPHLYAAKFLLCLLCLAIGLLLLIAGDMALNVMMSLLSGRGLVAITASFDGGLLLIDALAVALLELAVLGAFVAAITIFTRSMIAAVIPAFVLTLASALLQVYLGNTGEPLPLPASGADALRDWMFFQGNADAAGLGLLILGGWLIAATALGLTGFVRQQLSSE